MASKVANPRYCIQHSRFTKQDGWRLRDLSLSLNGNIAVTGRHVNTYRTCIDVYTNVRHSDSRDKPKIIYSKEFEKYESEEMEYGGRRVSFYPDSDTTILSGLGDKLEVIDLIQDRVIKSRQIKLVKHDDMFGQISCLSVRETEIFIGFRNKSNKIIVYDVIDLNEIKSIILQGIQDGYFPFDMTAVAERIFVCVGESKEESNEKSLIFEQRNGRILSELTKPSDTVQWYVNSVGVNMNTLGIAAVVWCDSYYYEEGEYNTVVFYSQLSENNCSFLNVEVEIGVDRIRISDRGDSMITGNERTGEVKVYDMAELFTFSLFKQKLASILQTDECTYVANFFKTSTDQIDVILRSDKPSENLLNALEEKGILQPYNVERLKDSFVNLGSNTFCLYLTDIYQKTRVPHPDATSFLAPRNTLNKFQDKRQHNELDHPVSGNELSGKRARTDAAHSGKSLCMEEVLDKTELTLPHRQTNSLLDQIQVSSGHLMEDRPPYPSSVSSESLAPVIGAAQGASSGMTATGMAMTLLASPPSINPTGPPIVSDLSTEIAGQSTVITCTPSHMIASSPVPAGPSVGAGPSSVVGPVQFRMLQSPGAREASIPPTLPLASTRQALYPLDTPSALSESTTFHRVSTTVGGLPQNSIEPLCLMPELPFQVPLTIQPGIPNRIESVVSPLMAQQTGLIEGYNFDQAVAHHERQGLQGRNDILKQVDNLIVHQDVQTLVQNQGNNVLQKIDHETKQCKLSPSNLAERQNETPTYSKKCEQFGTMNQVFSKQMKTAIESCVHNVVSPLLKDINTKLRHLLGSSSKRCCQEDISGTSSHTDNASDATARPRDSPDSEPDQVVSRAWESLSEYDRMSAQAFRGMTDDRAELVRRLVEMVFTEEERHNQNCFGKSGKQKLDGNKLLKIRHITFYLCPIITKSTDNDKLSLEDIEWKRLCEVIDKANRHFREKLKRQTRER